MCGSCEALKKTIRGERCCLLVSDQVPTNTQVTLVMLAVPHSTRQSWSQFSCRPKKYPGIVGCKIVERCSTNNLDPSLMFTSLLAQGKHAQVIGVTSSFYSCWGGMVMILKMCLLKIFLALSDFYKNIPETPGSHVAFCPIWLAAQSYASLLRSKPQ